MATGTKKTTWFRQATLSFSHCSPSQEETHGNRRDYGTNSAGLMAIILVDTCVISDLGDLNGEWFEWNVIKLERFNQHHRLVINTRFSTYFPTLDLITS